jgi:hypothetical protein
VYHSIKYTRNKSHNERQLDWAENDLCNSKVVGEANSSVFGLVPLCLNELRKGETMILKWVIVKGRNLQEYPACDCMHMHLHVYVCMCTYLLLPAAPGVAPFGTQCCSLFSAHFIHCCSGKTTHFTVYGAVWRVKKA